LRLVEDDERTPRHETIPLEVEPQPVGFLFEVEIRSRQRARERGLARLPRPEQEHRGRRPQALAHEARRPPSPHALYIRN
jgi:hypothetical protein